MAIKQIEREWNIVSGDYHKEFILDSAADVANLPKCAPGSVAVVADKGGAVYLVNASGECKEQ